MTDTRNSDNQLTEMFSFRLPAKMLRELERRASQEMTSTSTIARQILARELGMIPRPPNLLIDPGVEYETNAQPQEEPA